MNDASPILIGYDGSNPARRAVRETAKLFGSRRTLVVTVWEPALQFAVPAAGDGFTTPMPDLPAAEDFDDDVRARAEHVAWEGTELAKSVGLQAEAIAVPGEGSAADAIVELARQRRAAAIVLGSRGLTGLRARLEGSTSKAVLKHSSCPVLVVHED